jgi:hypothetical protein
VPVEGNLDISVIAPRIQGNRGADRGFIAGRSGAGKSFLARRLLTVYGVGETWPSPFRGNLVIIDPNDNFDFPTQGTFETVEEVKVEPKIRAVRYVPRPSEYSGEKWNALWKKLFYYRNSLIVYIDETVAMDSLFGIRRFEEGNFFRAYLTRGRAKNKAAIMASQRPVNIPRDIIGQAEWFYVFDLPLKDDRQTMSGTIGELGLIGDNEFRRVDDRTSLGRYEFWFKGPEDVTNTEYPVRAQILK